MSSECYLDPSSIVYDAELGAYIAWYADQDGQDLGYLELDNTKFPDCISRDRLQ